MVNLSLITLQNKANNGLVFFPHFSYILKIDFIFANKVLVFIKLCVLKNVNFQKRIVNVIYFTPEGKWRATSRNSSK